MQTSPEYTRPVIGISCGDLNGIGLELIIKTVSNSRLLEICTPIIFASNKAVNFYRKSMPESNFNVQNIKDFTRINPKQVNIFNCWEEEVAITPGQLTDTGGQYAILSLTTAVQALKDGQIQGLVTAPIHKKNTHTEAFPYTGHTPYLKDTFGAKEVVMLMVASNMKVALLTEHVPVNEIAPHITKQNIVSKLKMVEESMVRDFGIDKPKIAVLGLNPHAGDEGLIGNEEENIIRPAIREFKQQGRSIVQGPFSADAFFARGYHERFDAVLAMYHDQGLIPFKSLAHGEGVNFTAGLPVVRTSPDHGTAFDIAGKNKADESSMYSAIFTCVDIIRQRMEFTENRKNPLKKVTNRLLANAVDERIDLE
ncbi:4-hydroxythreonine-4-phosphate dehydrogenase PdxA [Flavihumibacter stibioxidans]|uniref:4-hydroxythreonine-4-phosphate dehydrogenase PdxA n=1 Tax=Flavihumibacter stibioxidans TaxID=1834163 RepID=A0ABR7M8E6_9BACT|nr:4-hydroxythreonine-4-phosphate dehydrogenase PdxA [Flavihumibacter stibioxidans]MBC6490898.1 4-hydroxythreonine-4-phosphate dehydrogenase PdxA [Flavihumibacter stibioxidans]